MMVIQNLLKVLKLEVIFADVSSMCSVYGPVSSI